MNHTPARFQGHIPARFQGSASRWLVALDIDGTLTSEGSAQIPERTAAAVAAVRAAGHEVVLASGRSLAGLLPVAARLGLSEACAVASNGAVTVCLTSQMPGGYQVIDAEMFETGAVIDLARRHLPGVGIAVEEVGFGYNVSQAFPAGTVNGRQRRLPLEDLRAAWTPRLILRAPGMAEQLLGPVRELGVTAHAGAEGDSIDVTPPGLSKGTALEQVRHRLGIAPAQVVVVGDSANDIDMFTWARDGGGRAVAMGHTPQAVRQAAGEVTGGLADQGVVTVLDSLLEARRPVLEVAR